MIVYFRLLTEYYSFLLACYVPRILVASYISVSLRSIIHSYIGSTFNHLINTDFRLLTEYYSFL